MTDPIGALPRGALTAVLVAASVLFVALRAPYWSVPLERDEGEYAYVAQRMLQGEVPYRDAFDQKPPGVFLVYAAAFVAFGESIESIHGMMHLFSAATALVLWLLVRRLAGDAASAFSVLAFAVMSTDSRIVATAANTEIFMLLPLSLCMLALVRALEDGRARWWLACGAFALGACWIKQVAAVNTVFVGLFAVGSLVRRRAGARRVLRAVALMLAGGAVVSLPLAAYFAWHGAWAEFVDAVFLHNLAYSQRMSWAAGCRNAWIALGHQAPSLAVFWILTLAAIVWPRAAPREIRILLAGWTVASLLGVSIGLYFRPHYFIQMLPPLAAAAGVAAGAVVGALPAQRALVRGAVVAAAIGVLGAPAVVANWATLTAGSPNAVSRRIYGLNPFPESLEIAKYIRRTSSPDDSIYVMGSEPQIFFYAERRSATRYIFFYPLMGAFPDAGQRQRELIREVQAANPRYVVVANLSTSLMANSNTDPYVFDETRRWLARHYRLEFVAIPQAGKREFDFIYGSGARAAMGDSDARAAPRAWVAVFRRS